MRIVIDMQGAQTESRFRGIGRYTMSFVKAVVRNRGDHDIILALSGLLPDTIEPIRATFEGILPQENIQVWHAPGPVAESQAGNHGRREVAELIREAFLASLEPDVVHVTSLFEGYVDDAVTSIGSFDQNTPVSLTLYDLIPLLNSDLYFKANPRYEQHYYRKVDHLSRASRLLAISDFSRREAIAHLCLEEQQVVNVSTAIEPHFYSINVQEEAATALRKKFNITRPFILCAGATDERKNIARLVEAFATLPPESRGRFQLVLAGGISTEHLNRFLSIASELGLGKNELIVTGYVDEQELLHLYNLSHLYVFPSWHEGFGLPALEAMACGAPVIGANTSSLPEVIALDDALFDPLDVTSIRNKMDQALSDTSFRAKLSAHGLQRAKFFSWDETAKRAIAAFEALQGFGEKVPIDTDQVYEALAPHLAMHSETILFDISACLALNQQPHLERQLLVDISELVQHDAKTGIQRVVRNVLLQWLKNPPVGYRVEPVYATVNQPYRYARHFTSRLLGIVDQTCIDRPIDFANGDVFFALDFQAHIQVAQSAFLQEMRRQGVAVKFMVYDLLCLQQPHHFVRGAEEAFTGWLKVVCETDGAVCISQTVADQLADWMKNNVWQRQRKFMIEWNHLGAELKSTQSHDKNLVNANNRSAQLNEGSTFLMVGTLEPRKGHAQVLDAFDRLWKENHRINLVIVGNQGWMVDGLVKRLRNHVELNKRLFWHEGSSDEHLEQFYATSTCLIAASYGEGFGLPLIEAAQNKLPIMARDIPVFREVAGDHAYYFTADSAFELAQSITIWQGLYQGNQHPKPDQMPWCTWKESSDSLITVLLDNPKIK